MKNVFLSSDITKILQTVFDIFGMPGQAHKKDVFQLAENFDVYQHAKNQLHHSFLP